VAEVGEGIPLPGGEAVREQGTYVSGRSPVVADRSGELGLGDRGGPFRLGGQLLLRRLGFGGLGRLLHLLPGLAFLSLDGLESLPGLGVGLEDLFRHLRLLGGEVGRNIQRRAAPEVLCREGGCRRHERHGRKRQQCGRPEEREGRDQDREGGRGAEPRNRDVPEKSPEFCHHLPSEGDICRLYGRNGPAAHPTHAAETRQTVQRDLEVTNCDLKSLCGFQEYPAGAGRKICGLP